MWWWWGPPPPQRSCCWPSWSYCSQAVAVVGLGPVVVVVGFLCPLNCLAPLSTGSGSGGGQWWCCISISNGRACVGHCSCGGGTGSGACPKSQLPLSQLGGSHVATGQPTLPRTLHLTCVLLIPPFPILLTWVGVGGCSICALTWGAFCIGCTCHLSPPWEGCLCFWCSRHLSPPWKGVFVLSECSTVPAAQHSHVHGPWGQEEWCWGRAYKGKVGYHD